MVINTTTIINLDCIWSGVEPGLDLFSADFEESALSLTFHLSGLLQTPPPPQTEQTLLQRTLGFVSDVTPLRINKCLTDTGIYVSSVLEISKESDFMADKTR